MHPKTRGEKRYRNQRIVIKRIGQVTDYTYFMHGPEHGNLYWYHLSQFAKVSPFNYGGKGRRHKDKYIRCKRRSIAEELSDYE